MIKRLNLFNNPAENDLAQTMVDKSHQRIRFSIARKIFKNISNEKYYTSLLQILKKNLKCSSNTLKIKSLILLHYLIKKTMFKNQRLLQFAERQLNQLKNKKPQQNTTKTKILIENQQKQYIKKNIIEFYVMYLLKFIVHQESFVEANFYTQMPGGNLDRIFQEKRLATQQTTSQTKLDTISIKSSEQQCTLMLHINNGFQIINLINYIIQSQQSFNKMGRYYIQQDQILNLFIMYLDDLTIYNDYVKKLARILTKRVALLKEQEVRHCFLYLTQSQKISDRLYEFYYNRYYYSKVKKLISLPTFLNIENDDFERVVKQIKRVDKQLFLTVKESKYSQQYKQNKTMQCITEATFVQKSPSKPNMNRTMFTEASHRNIQFINKTIQNLKIPTKSMKQIEQNITQYIQTFQDIDDDFI